MSSEPRMLSRPSSLIGVPEEGGSLTGYHKIPRPDYVIEDRGYETPCWIWQKTLNPAGHGTSSFASVGIKTAYAHRAYYIAANGEIPDGWHVHHRCKVRPCVNPDHLEATSATDHFMEHKLHEKTGLTFDDIREIRRLATVEGVTAPALAKQYGIHEITVYDYWSSNHWAELLGGEHAGRPVRTCPECGGEFSDRKRDAKFCCAEHRRRFNARAGYRRRKAAHV